jgi:hypothetical protein
MLDHLRKEIEFIESLHTDKLKHSGRNLLTHLMGTAKILEDFKRPLIEQKAGLLHSIYGTDFYPDSSSLGVTREQIKSLVGDECENLIFIFCKLTNRTESIISDMFVDPVKTQLRWIELANLIEQKKDNSYTQRLRELLNLDKPVRPFFKEVFPTPLGFANLGEAARELNRQLVADIETERGLKETAKRTFSGNENGWQSEIGMEKKYNSFITLKNVIEKLICPIILKTGYSQEYVSNGIVIDSLWANIITGNSGWSQPHVHGTGNTIWSGVYYPKSDHSENLNLDEIDHDTICDPNLIHEGGSLVLMDPARVQKGLVLGKANKYPYYGGNIYIRPRESLLVMFPTTLEHYVTPVSHFVSNRYSISFSVNKKK